jgi:hypothetical protein
LRLASGAEEAAVESQLHPCGNCQGFRFATIHLQPLPGLSCSKDYYGNNYSGKTRAVDGTWAYYYHRKPLEASMARPRKDKRLLKNIPLRIMLTADQKALIEAAARLEQLDMTAWARPVLLQAAEERVAKTKKTQAAS